MIDLSSELRKTTYVDPMSVAYFSLALGDADGWFEWAELGYSERSPRLRFVHISAPDFIRSDPRFDDLVSRIGLPGT